MTNPGQKTWNDHDGLAFEVWKYCGGIAGADKDKMIKIVTWLLGFSSAIIGFIASGRTHSFWATVLLIVLGGSVSILAALTALLYGGYAARNWVIADRIAVNYNWTELRPDYDLGPRFNAFPLSLAKPCQDKIAPVFWIFFGVSIISLGAHIALLSHVALSCYK